MATEMKPPMCIIKQQAGIGDVVCWPLKSSIYEAIKAHVSSDVKFVSIDDQFRGKAEYLSSSLQIREVDGIIHVPLETADQIYPHSPIIQSKYDFVDLPLEGWADHLILNRNTVREDEMYNDILGIKDGEKYVLINPIFATPPETQRVNIEVSSDIRQIEFQMFPNDSIFDWCKVFENATEIHTVQTAIQSLCEVLDLKGEILKVYQRPGWGDDFSYLTGVYPKHAWEYVVD